MLFPDHVKQGTTRSIDFLDLFADDIGFVDLPIFKFHRGQGVGSPAHEKLLALAVSVQGSRLNTDVRRAIMDKPGFVVGGDGMRPGFCRHLQNSWRPRCACAQAGQYDQGTGATIPVVCLVPLRTGPRLG